MNQRSNALAVWSLILGIVGLLTGCIVIGIAFDIVAIVLGVIGIKKECNKGLCVSGIILGGIGAVLMFIILALGGIGSIADRESDATTQATTEITTEATTEAYTEEPELTKEEFEEQVEEVTYEDLFRMPETYRDKPIKIVVYIDEYDTQLLGLLDVYYASVDGQDIYLSDTRTVKEPTITKGDTVLIYGYGSGLATLEEYQKNLIGIKTESEKTQIPSVDIKYCELQ